MVYGTSSSFTHTQCTVFNLFPFCSPNIQLIRNQRGLKGGGTSGTREVLKGGGTSGSGALQKGPVPAALDMTLIEQRPLRFVFFG